MAAMKTTAGQLTTLPTEIILRITAQGIPCSSLAALRQTSRTFYHECELTPIGKDSSKSDKLDFLAMLARDTPRPGHAICSTCIRLHTLTSFSEKELSKRPRVRQCIATSRMWTCPHRTFTLSEAEEVLSLSDPFGEKVVPTCDRCGFLTLNTRLCHGPDVRNVSFITQYRLLEAVCRTNDVRDTIQDHFTTGRVSFLLDRLQIPICQHMRSSQTPIATHFRPEHLKVVRECNRLTGRERRKWRLPWHKGHDSGWYWTCPVKDCMTMAVYEAREVVKSNGERQVSLILILEKVVFDRSDKSNSEAWWANHSISDSYLKMLNYNWLEWENLFWQCNRVWRSTPDPPASIEKPSISMAVKSWMKAFGRRS